MKIYMVYCVHGDAYETATDFIGCFPTEEAAQVAADKYEGEWIECELGVELEEHENLSYHEG